MRRLAWKKTRFLMSESMDVPAALKSLPNWVLWKGPKIPYQVSGSTAKSNDSTTWNTYEAVSTIEGYCGVGFVFDGNGIFGIDLDGCVSPDGTIQPWACKIVDAFATYAEISPSGTGIKLFGFGRLPGGGKKKILDEPVVAGDRKPAIEIYGHGRYFTFTGDRCSPQSDLAECQAALDALYARLWPPPVHANIPPIVSQSSVAERARAYLDRIPPAISGSERGKATFRVACVLVNGFCLTIGEALPLITQWNQKCQPQTWAPERIEKELLRTLANAEKQPGEKGWLLSGSRYDGPDPDIRQLLDSLAIEPEQPPPPEPDVAFPRECVEGLPWMMRLAYDYAMATAIKPQPELTLGALIALFGAIFGRKVRDDYNTRTNIYILGLSPSGSGKEHPRQTNKQILCHSGMELVNGPERIGSHAGIVSSLAQHPVRLFQIDEIGRLLATMRDPKAAPHLHSIGTVLMQLYSSANTLWIGDAYADVAKVKRLNQPCACVFGTSVPDSFYAGFSAENLADGLLGRMLVIESSGYSKRRKPKVFTPPTDLIEGIKHWQNNIGGNLSLENPVPILVLKTPEADQRHEQYCNEVHDRHGKDDSVSASVWSRAPEKAAKLALIYACCDAQNLQPVITLDAINWGRRLANYCTRLVVQSSRSRMVLSHYDAEKRRAWDRLQSGMTASEFTRKTQWMHKRERNEILQDWLECGAVVEEISGTTKPKKILRKMRQTP